MRKYINHIKGSRSSRCSYYIILFWILVAFLADFIANEKPLYIKSGEKTSWPIFKSYQMALMGKAYQYSHTKISKEDKVVYSLIPYSHFTLDAKNTNFKGPFEAQNIQRYRFRHWLGTDQLGRDVLAGLIHGSRVAAIVGFCTIFIAGSLGLFFGLIAGYFGNKDFKISIYTSLFLIFGFPILLYIGYYYLLQQHAIQSHLSILNMIVVASLIGFITYIINRIFNTRKPKSTGVPIDMGVMKIIEILRSIPNIFILLALLPLFSKPSIVNIFLLLGLISWPGIALLIRAEALKQKELPYIQSGKMLGFSSRHIIVKHLLSNCLGPFWVAIAFGVSGAIVSEATLSFLGIGLPINEVSWGSMLNNARSHFSAWWMVLFPGFALFIVILCFNIIGDRLRISVD